MPDVLLIEKGVNRLGLGFGTRPLYGMVMEFLWFPVNWLTLGLV